MAPKFAPGAPVLSITGVGLGVVGASAGDEVGGSSGDDVGAADSCFVLAEGQGVGMESKRVPNLVRPTETCVFSWRRNWTIVLTVPYLILTTRSVNGRR